LGPASPAAKLGRGWNSSDQTRCPTPRCIRYAGHWLSSGRQFRGCADNRIGVARLDVPECLPQGAVADPPEAKV
jgi:hypothetical protein